MTQTSQEKTYTHLEIKKLPDSEVEVSGEVPVHITALYRTKALRALLKDLELPGFRKGHVPEDVAIRHVGESALLKETAEIAIGEVYADIVMDEKLDVVGRPAVTITKLAVGNPIGFKIQSALFPEITLPDYMKIAEKERKKFKNRDSVKIKDEEVEKELARLQEMMTAPPKEGEEATPPPIDDSFAKNLGGFESLADLKEKMKSQMLIEKKHKEQEKERLTLADAIINKTVVEVPGLFIEGELDQMVASFNERVERAGMKMEEYLTQAGKTIEDLRKEWRTDAEKRAKLQLIFNEIAKKEHISPDDEKLKREVAHIKEHYPEAQEESIKIYVRAQMNNEIVFQLLEGAEVGKGVAGESDGN